MRNRRHTLAAWIALAAFLLSSIWSGLALAHDHAPSFAEDICSVSRTNDRSAPLPPTHVHKHCTECVFGAGLEFATPTAEQTWSAAPLSQSLPITSVGQGVPPLQVTAKSPRGPPQLT
jgi:hypothetical protein